MKQIGLKGVTYTLVAITGLLMGLSFNKWSLGLSSTNQFVVSELLVAYVFVGIMLWHRVGLIDAFSMLSERMYLFVQIARHKGAVSGLTNGFVYAVGIPGMCGFFLPFVLIDRGLKRFMPVCQTRLHQTRLIAFLDEDWEEFWAFHNKRLDGLLRPQ